MNKVLARWNSLDAADAAREALPCCGSRAWAIALASRRPIADEASLAEASTAIWWALPEQAWREAFDSHPRIGQKHAVSHATTESLQWSAKEQQNVSADDATRLALAEANRRYEQKFGRIFIVSATRKSSPQILALLETRLQNDHPTELREAAEQQHQITQLRLNKWMNEELTMGISTHILDTASGRPAAGVPITLARLTNGTWSLLNEDHTDADGRCKRLLPPTQTLQRGVYRIHFETAVYYEKQHLQGLYPFVEVAFVVSDSEQNYHIPLLLTANGYTTYRGS
jgi:2-oxo-4-hydroxy-4-carboxy-5-ureidoimidazoline decarboxylase